MLDNHLLEILACPLCKAKVSLNQDKTEIICSKCKLAYPIDDGIPVMLIDKAKKIEQPV